MEDLAGVLAAAPEVLVIGQGASGLLRVPDPVRKALEARGIRVVAAPTAEVVREYNALAGARRVVAALHLTC
jgi:hypothetical protein